MRGSREGLDTSAEPSPAVAWAELDFSGATCPARGRPCASITVVSFCWRICLISESMDHHDSEIMDDGSID